MRTRVEIETQLVSLRNEIGAVNPAESNQIVIELLLDIRDLLSTATRRLSRLQK
jgi:hypothetical protein